MILVEDGDKYFTIADFFCNDKEHYIKIFYRDGKTRLIQDVGFNIVFDDGIIRLSIKRDEAYEKSK